MSKRWTKWGWWLALAVPVAVQAQVDLTTLDQDMTGPRAQVLVLGSVHLSGMPKGFKPESLDPVLDRLAAFKPDVITIEALSGEECDLAARHAAVYGSDYCANRTPVVQAFADEGHGFENPNVLDIAWSGIAGFLQQNLGEQPAAATAPVATAAAAAPAGD